MLLSQTSQYGLRAILYLATHQARDGQCISISTIAANLNISFHFLTKILQQLTAEGILTSYRGPGGGVSLARDPATLTLYDVVVTLEGVDMFKSCVLGLGDCNDAHPCPLHVRWKKTRQELRVLFDSATLGEMAERIQSTEAWLVD